MNDSRLNAQLVSRLQRLSRWAAIVMIGIGASVILGWVFNIPLLKSFLPSLPTMKFNTALCFILCGIGLLRLHAVSPRLTLIFSAIVALIGLVTLVEYISGWDLGIDQWLVHDTATTDNVFPGRMSPISAFNFALAGISLLFNARSRRLALAQSLMLVIAFTALLSLAGYIYGVPSLYQIRVFTSIALHTTITFIFLCLAIFFIYPDQGLSSVVVSDRTGGLLARRLLPVAIIVPLLVSWLRVKGQQLGLYGSEFGLALFALTNVAVFSAVVYGTARLLNHLDNERDLALGALRHANDQLETRVQERTAELRKSEELLRQSETRFTAAFRASPAAISITTLPEGRWIEVNEALAKMTGYSSEELIGHTSTELGLVDSTARARILESINAQGSVHDVEIQLRTKSNEIVEVLVSAEQIEINGQPCVLSIQYDITGLKRAEAALQASEERYRNLFDNAPIGISIGQGAARMYVNPAFVHMFGYDDPREIISGSALNQVAPQARGEIIERLSSDPPPAGQAISFESLGQKKDGTIFPVQIQLARLELSAGTQRVIFVTDISVAKRAESALRENEQKLQTFFELLPVGVSVLNAAGQIIEMNPALERILGMSKEGIASGAYKSRKYIRSDGTPLSPSDFPSVRALAEQQTIHDMEIGVIKEDETLVWTSVSAAPLPFANSTVILATADITARKLAESRFRALLESAPDAMVIANQQGNIVLVNSQAETLFGYRRDDLIGKPVEMLMPQRNQTSHVAHRGVYNADPRVRSMGMGLKLFALRKDGSEFPVEISLSPIQTEDGLLISTSIRDITDRIQTENVLRESEERFRLVFDNSLDAVLITEPNGNILMANKEACRLFGRDEEELRQVGRNAVVDLSDPRLTVLLEERQRTGSARGEMNVVRRDGSLCPAEVSSKIYSGSDGKLKTSMVIHDMSRRVKMENALRESESRFRLLVENLRQVFWLITPDGSQTEYISPAYESVWGRSRQEMYDDPLSFLSSIHLDDQERVNAARQNDLLSGNYNVEYRIFHQDASIHWISSKAFPIYNDQNQIIRVAGISEDITERKLAEQQALELAKEREQVKILSDFIRDISHDFRTPLSIISTSLYLLSKISDPEKQDVYYGRAKLQILRLTLLIERLLTMARLDSPIDLDLRGLDVNKMVSELCILIGPEAKEKDIMLHCALWESPLMVQVDKEELNAALAELGKNAVLYTPSTGTITIRTLQQDNQAVIEVHDTGTGIPAPDLPHIFERLYRVDKARSQETGGAGLGLSIAKRIVEYHQGTLEAESVEGEGSIFRVRLPLDQIDRDVSIAG